MSHQTSFLLLSGCLALSCFSFLAQADTITTETTTTTTAPGSTALFTLPSTGEYVVVDPITGAAAGRYDPVARLVNGRTLQSGVVIVDKPTGNLVATVDASGRIVDVGVAPVTDVLMVSLDTRRKDLDQQIAESLTKGNLSAARAAVFRADLERISNEEAAYRQSGGTLTYRQALVTGYNLNTLAQRVNPSVAFVPAVSPQFVLQDKQITMVDEVTYRRLQLTRRIDDEYQAGRLSSAYVSRLNMQADKVASLEARSRKHGELSASKSRAISSKLDQLESSMNSDVQIINQKRARIGIRVN